jgi:hypothetical protein
VAEAAGRFRPTDEGNLHWLALNLTPGLGSDKGAQAGRAFWGNRKYFQGDAHGAGSNWHSDGFRAIDRHWAIDGTGLSGVGTRVGCGNVVCFDDPAYPQQLKQTTIRRSFFICAEILK